MEKQAMKMIPAFKDYLWGGQRLVEEFGKKTDMRPLAESWEVSCHPDGPSVVENGEFAGKTLAQVLAQYPIFLGTAWENTGEFPVLIKLIDAKDNLSLQVHPDNAYAKENEGQQGKNEMWYVVDALPGSALIIGFQKEVSPEELKERIENNTILDIVNSIPVKAGDCFEIPAGMLHAIGAGVLVAEVQQSSNVTYRVYDYDRRGADGKPRELHVKKALDVTNSVLATKNTGENPSHTKDSLEVTPLSSWQWFTANKLVAKGSGSIQVNETSFQALTVLEGQCTVAWQGGDLTASKGESVFLPASLGPVTIAGDATLLQVQR